MFTISTTPPEDARQLSVLTFSGIVALIALIVMGIFAAAQMAGNTCRVVRSYDISGNVASEEKVCKLDT